VKEEERSELQSVSNCSRPGILAALTGLGRQTLQVSKIKALVLLLVMSGEKPTLAFSTVPSMLSPSLT
jgi:hypothetical protein